MVKQRICPMCLRIISYNKDATYRTAKSRNSRCVECFNKRKNGKTNPFYGKKHSDETKRIISKKRKELHIVPKNGFQKGQPSANKKPVYQCWLEKYGKNEADRLNQIRKEKWSKSSTGINNPMYGKPSPKGSGNGWSGWYNQHFFRSLRELSYILYLEENSIKWENGENQKYRIKYTDWNGQERNYYPDFILPEQQKIIECKPVRIQKSITNINKESAGKKFAKKIGYTYEMIDVIINSEKVKHLLKNKKIVFTKRTLEKWKKYNI